MPSPQLEYLVAQVESIYDCKIDTATLNTQMVEYDAAIDQLVSDIEAVEQRLDVLESPHILVVKVKNILACKIYTTVLNNQMAALDITLLNQESDLAQLESRLGVLESGLLKVLGE